MGLSLPKCKMHRATGEGQMRQVLTTAGRQLDDCAIVAEESAMREMMGRRVDGFKEFEADKIQSFSLYGIH